MKEFKDYLKKELVKKLGSVGSNEPGRLETICRSIINRRSYNFVFDGETIYLEKDGRKIIIEQADRKQNDSWNRRWVADKAKKIVDEILVDEEIIRNYRSAV